MAGVHQTSLELLLVVMLVIPARLPIGSVPVTPVMVSGL